MFRRFIAAAFISIACLSTGFAADAKAHHIAIQVDQNDPAIMNLVLNNATHVIEIYRAKNEEVDVDIVAYGPGLHMLRDDTSPVQDRLRQLKDRCCPARCSFRPATIPSRAWKRPRATRSRSWRKLPSYRQAWCI